MAQHVTTTLGLVEAGLGVAALPSVATPGPEHPLLLSLPWVDPVVTRKVGLNRRQGWSLSLAALQLYGLFGAVGKRRRGGGWQLGCRLPKKQMRHRLRPHAPDQYATGAAIKGALGFDSRWSAVSASRSVEPSRRVHEIDPLRTPAITSANGRFTQSEAAGIEIN